MKFKPNMYYQNIYNIPYSLLKKQGYRCLVFDLDNTLIKIKDENCSKDTITLIKKLKKDFKIYILSNNKTKRLKHCCQELEVKGYGFALKPLTIGLNKIKKDGNFKKQEMIIIGDQLLTDIKAGLSFKITTIYVDYIEEKDLKINILNRYLENKILNKYTKQAIMERGKYYES